MMKPYQTLLFLLAVGVLSALTMWIFPKDGIVLSEKYSLKFPQFDDFLPDTTSEKGIDNLEEFLAVYEEPIDSTAIKDSLKRVEAARRKALLRIQWKDENREILEPLFQSMESAKEDTGSFRIMHYGDSQIETDRITAYLRNEFQKEFGGLGPGLLPVVQTIGSPAMEQSNSENWHRYSLIGKRDTLVKHKRYGLMATFYKFTPIPGDTIEPDTSLHNAWLSFETSNLSYKRSRRFKKMKMYYGMVEDSVTIKTFLSDSLMSTDTLEHSAGFEEKIWEFEETPKKIRLEFEGQSSPEFYGFSFESDDGIYVDNIPMRGSSGTIFRRIDAAQLETLYAGLNVKLFLLQYGGNTVPYIKDTANAENYGRWFKAQINYLKKIEPEAGIIVIGPSDMSTKVGTSFETYPFLELVRDELKEAAFETGAGFWDIYEVMGGRNSMQSWVEADPPLAGKDYVHFTSKGARKIAELFHKALWQDYTEWKNRESPAPEVVNDTLPVEETVEKDSVETPEKSEIQ